MQNILRTGSQYLKRALPSRAWRPMRAVATAALTPIRFSMRTGHWRSSLAAAACAPNKNFHSLVHLSGDRLSVPADISARHVLEFGGGQSTLWWSARAQSVLTIEEDRAWYNKIRPLMAANVALHHIPVDHETRDTTLVRKAITSTKGRSLT